MVQNDRHRQHFFVRKVSLQKRLDNLCDTVQYSHLFARGLIIKLDQFDDPIGRVRNAVKNPVRFHDSLSTK
jgi:hypothetical protein